MMVYEQQAKLDAEEPESRRPVSRKVLLLSVVAGLLVAVGLIGFVVTIPARANQEPTSEDNQLAELFTSQIREEETSPANANGTALELEQGHRRAQTCACFTQVTAHRNRDTAIYNCLNTVAKIRCSRGCRLYLTRVFQIVYRGNYYVNCRCCR